MLDGRFDLEFGVEGLGIRVQGLGLSGQEFGFRVKQVSIFLGLRA